MERYIQQLVEDLRDAAGRVAGPDPLWNIENSEELKGFEEVERFLHGPQQKLSAIVGIESIQFPPPERLTADQQTLLYNEMEALLAAYFFVPDFPERLPLTLCYKILRAHWDDEHVFVGAGKTHIDFCEYAVDQCIFPPEFCECRLLNDDDDVDGGGEGWGKGGEEELPF